MKKKSAARKVALPAILCALSLILTYVGVIAPSGRWGIIAVAGLCPAAAVISVGFGAGLLCWASTAILAFLLVPDKFCALLYAVLFGLYPVLKALFERVRNRPVSCLLKILFFNLSLTVLFLTMKGALLGSLPGILSATWLLYVAGNIVFILYDFGMSKLISIYIARLRRVRR